MEIHGIGPATFEKYGKLFIEIIRAYESTYDDRFLDSTENESYDYLRTTRNEITWAEQCSAAKGFTNKILERMAMTHPNTKEEMLRIYGVNLEKYGI